METEYEILKVTDYASKFGGGRMYYIFLKSDEGKSFKTCIDDSYRNYGNWKHLMTPGNVLAGVRTKVDRFGKTIIDADSTPRLVKTKVAEPEFAELVKDEPSQTGMF